MTALADELAVADSNERMEDELSSWNNLVVFLFTEMGRLREKQVCGES